MNRYSERSVTLDGCSACGGIWFDTGELAAVFGLTRYQGLASGTVPDSGAPSEGSLIFDAAMILARAFLPFP
jgi:Zn-finger nucleic acid-binding protein